MNVLRGSKRLIRNYPLRIKKLILNLLYKRFVYLFVFYSIKNTKGSLMNDRIYQKYF